MTIRQPRAWLQVASGLVNIMHAEVVLSRMSMGSTFVVRMALDDASNPGLAFWSQETPLPASVVATNDLNSGQNKVLLQGQIDIVDVQLEQRIVLVQGSDLMSTFADTRSDQQFPNMTKSQVISTIVAKHGFVPHIDGTSDMAGKSYDGQDWAHITDNENELDVIQQIANSEGKIAFMVGQDFYFTDPGNVQGSTFPIVYTPPGQAQPPSMYGSTLRLLRNVQLGSVTSKAASFPSYDKQPYVGEAGENGADAGASNQGFDEKGFE